MPPHLPPGAALAFGEVPALAQRAWLATGHRAEAPQRKGPDRALTHTEPEHAGGSNSP